MWWKEQYYYSNKIIAETEIPIWENALRIIIIDIKSLPLWSEQGQTENSMWCI